jgi:acyl-homoserine lactone acylase PvdQ
MSEGVDTNVDELFLHRMLSFGVSSDSPKRSNNIKTPKLRRNKPQPLDAKDDYQHGINDQIAPHPSKSIQTLCPNTWHIFDRHNMSQLRQLKQCHLFGLKILLLINIFYRISQN